jgi:acyl-CoA hydrolase
MRSIKYLSGAQAVKMIHSGQRVFVHGGAATPQYLLGCLMERAEELRDVELVSISLQGSGEISSEKYKNAFHLNSLFVSPNIRSAVQEGRGDYVPVFLSEIPRLFREKLLQIDVALVHVSPPDSHGYCSLGVSVDIARAAVQGALHVIAQVNPRMPRTHGEGLIHVSELDALVEVQEELPEVSMGGGDEISATIGRFCAELIPDGATLQMGIGAIPDATLSCLNHHKNLGIHTEMFSDGLLPLLESGVVTNHLKRKHAGRTVTGFALGSRKLYDFVDDNPSIAFIGIDYVNDESVIRQNPSVVAINSAIEIDLTGQVCSDSIGTLQYSGVGGQMDFIRGASLSKGGKPIIALPSVTAKGISRIVSMLKPGAGVVTTRAHVHFVVTEYGVAYLFGKNLRQRSRALIKIAHPSHREELERAYVERFGRDFYTLH